MTNHLQAELARVRKVHGIDEHQHRRRRELHEQHTLALSTKLRPSVQNALLSEALQDVGAEWIELAASILREQVDLGADDGLLAQAEQELIADVARSLATENRQPDPDEIEDHAVELAQLLLSNWSALLEHALEDSQDGRVTLVDRLPDSALFGQDVAGIEGFAVSAADAMRVFSQFQTDLVEQGAVAELTPTVHVFCFNERWRVAASRDLAWSWREQLERDFFQEIINFVRKAAERVTQTINPVAALRCTSLQTFVHHYRPQLSVGEEVELATELAVNAVVLAQHEHSLLSAVDWESVARFRPSSLELARCIRDDLRSSQHDPLDPLRFPLPAYRPEVLKGLSHVTAVDVGSAYRVSLIASGAALSVGHHPGVGLLSNHICQQWLEGSRHREWMSLAPTVSAVLSDAPDLKQGWGEYGGESSARW